MLQRFYGNVSLDQTRVGPSVSVTLEITAQLPSGVPDNIVRIVTENANALKFGQHGFEEG